ncbi:hypothetical protein [Nonomuraea sp. NPDC052265]|uniref:hypothetical protein n=1 Tax=Nonomuraea sp. NPDC052265 TaxID=3364374 RepID=UPI0037C5CC83
MTRFRGVLRASAAALAVTAAMAAAAPAPAFRAVDPPGDPTTLWNVDVLDATHAYAVGWRGYDGSPDTSVLRLRQGAWTVSALPGDPGNGSASISGDGEGHLVIPTGGGTTAPAYLYFDGASWTRVGGPARPSAGYAGAYAVDRVPGTSTILSVGGANVTNLTGFAISDLISPR